MSDLENLSKQSEQCKMFVLGLTGMVINTKHRGILYAGF